MTKFLNISTDTTLGGNAPSDEIVASQKAIKTAVDTKVSKTGDSMTNDLEMVDGCLYLEGIGSTVSLSTSRLVLGTPNNKYAYLTGNSKGVFGIYSEKSGSRKGIACYPDQNFFADTTTKTIDLGRSNNVWKTCYVDTVSDGTKSITVANIVAKQDALVSGTNIKTVNGTSVLGSGDISTTELPSQSGQSGKFLTTNGTTVSWATVGGGGSSTLAGLSDVTLTSPSDGQVLTYDNGDWVNADPTGGYHPDLFDWKWADHQLDDVQWLRADTFSWQSGSVYQAAYQHLVDDISGKTAQSETVGGVTISFYLADDGHKISTDESAVAQVYAATGVAWYYVLDTVNQRFKLPRTKFGVTGLRDTVGKYVEAGSPNIEGQMTRVWSPGSPSASGAVSIENSNYTGAGAYDQNVKPASWTLKINASDSNPIYGNSTTVQPPATQMYLYFYVGQFTQTALENTAGLNAELFNGKADVSTVAHVVTEFQEPTAQNNYTWYRKYADGWVEQGGIADTPTADTTYQVTIPITMSDANYLPQLTTTTGNNNAVIASVYTGSSITTTGFYFRLTHKYNSGGTPTKTVWQVSGIAA